MIIQTQSFILDGLTARALTVEVDVRPGLPSFTFIGMADAATRELRERCRAAILNSAYHFPVRRITVNIEPPTPRRLGSGLDVALACALLAASGQVGAAGLGTCVFFGELGLDGRIRPVAGAQAVARAARARGVATLVLAAEDGTLAGTVPGLLILPAADLQAAVAALSSAPALDADTSPDADAEQEAEYTVAWEIDVCALSPRAAAEQALAIQRRPASSATVFDVRRRGETGVLRIDLDDNDAAEHSTLEQSHPQSPRRSA